MLGLVPSACDVAPATPSDSIVVPYQFNIEFAIEDDGEDAYVARARFYDIAQAYDITGNAGTIELTGDDEVYAAGIHLDIETRTTFLNILRVDYSQTIPAGQDAYLFELRRSGQERIEATVPIPPPFEVEEVGEVSWRDMVVLEWEPVIDGATIDIGILPLDDGCLTVVGGGAGDVVKGLDDTGRYRFHTDVYHSPDHDCTYELIFSRRSVEVVPGHWIKDGRRLPANNVYAVGVHTVRRTFVAARR
jgi:hypothetical protein